MSEALIGQGKANLIRGKGQKNLNCDLYYSCLDIAAKKNWQSFNCESCDNNKPASKGESTVTRNALIIKEIEALIGKPSKGICHIS